MIKKEEEEYEIYKKCESTKRNIKKINRLEDLNIEDFALIKRPRNESETSLLLAAILSDANTRDYIEDISGIISYSLKASTDMICIDNKGKNILVEVEFKISNFFRHKHPIETVDYIVCWIIDIEMNMPYRISDKSCVLISKGENKYLRFNEKIIKVIELKSIIEYVNNKSYVE
ncbi:hypothetical protein [Paraclostridium bifermentans]|uniref:hypothetical protein n=1 Tax=Paraclostridium bifermentans TaxID=1490 RepID=UPI001D00CBC6|nr:hypothetical protein [Paraclostridium bifermentans]